MIKVKQPLLFISWYENLEPHRIGPFYTASPDGENSYQVQRVAGVFERITIPTKYHTLEAMQ